MPDEDAYWERYRERIEAQRCDEPYLEEDMLSIDEIADEIENEYGSLDSLDEYDLLDIVKNETGIAAVSAEFDRSFWAIFYIYDAA